MQEAIRLPAVLIGPGASEFLQTVRVVFNLHDTSDLTIVDQAFVNDDTMLYLRFVREVPVRGKELGKADGVYIVVGGTLSLQFDSKGVLSSYFLEDEVEDSIVEEKNGLLKDLEKGRIYFAEPDEIVDPLKLKGDGKRFFIQVDKDGKKRLHRAYL